MTTTSVFLPPAIQDYITRVGVTEPEILARLRDATATLPQAYYQVAPEEGQILRLLVRLTGARRILEIGTFTGYSTLAMALEAPAAHITTLDVSEEFTAIARRFWQDASVADRITLILAPALETLARLRAETGDPFDLVFIDADKEGYPDYYEHALALSRPGALILIDNTLWRGTVADDTIQKKKTKMFRTFNEALQADDRVLITLLPVGDGLTLAVKKDT